MQKVVYFDIDDTLVRSVGQKRIVMPAVVAEARRLKAEGAILYLWSSGGAAYCHATAIELAIEELFTAFLAKPTVYVDDQPLSEWRLCHHLYPAQADQA